jgi:RNA polymerase sigma factor (sigma-70 family)
MRAEEHIEHLKLALRTYEGPLLRYVLRITGDLDRARDVVQEAFIKLCRQKFSHVEDHLAEWLFTVCRNRALDLLKKEGRLQPFEGNEPRFYKDPAPGPAKQMESKEDSEGILRLMEKLPAIQQEVIRLKFQEDLSYKEISQITKLSVNNVGFLIHIGIKTLRGKMKNDPAFAAEIREKNYGT